MLDLLSTAHAARVLGTLERMGGEARFTPLRDAVGIGDRQLSRALQYLNGEGMVGAKVLAEGDRAPLLYFVSVHGQETLDVLRAWHQAIHGQNGDVVEAADRELEAIVGA